MSTAEVTLVLGAPGQVALRVVAGLLARGERVLCVAPSPVGLDELRPYLAAEGLAPGALERLEVLEGEASAIDLGLAGSEYTALAERATRVIVAVEQRVVPESVEGAAAVRTAVELTELVEAGGARRGAVVLSSLLVFGTAVGVFREDELGVGQSFRDELEEALAVAERVLRRGVPAELLAVLRTAPIAGDSELGVLDERSALAQLSRKVRVLAPGVAAGARDLPCHFECAARAARALLALWSEGRAGTVHLVDAAPLLDRELLAWLAARHARQLVDEPAASRGRHLLELPDVPAAYTVTGWSTRFDQTEARRRLGALLHVDPRARLSGLLGPLPETDEPSSEPVQRAVEPSLGPRLPPSDGASD
jgi:nucleoside-diphosphate-sugar epimerase